MQFNISIEDWLGLKALGSTGLFSPRLPKWKVCLMTVAGGWDTYNFPSCLFSVSFLITLTQSVTLSHLTSLALAKEVCIVHTNICYCKSLQNQSPSCSMSHSCTLFFHLLIFNETGFHCVGRKTGTCCVDQANLNLTEIHLPLQPECL